jgi:plasmid stabilization system protein ParE
VTEVILGPGAGDDLERLATFLLESDPIAAESTAALILDGLRILATHPLIGRSVSPSHRQLAISRGRTGYVALYSYDDRHDRVLVKAIRHQREAGFDE